MFDLESFTPDQIIWSADVSGDKIEETVTRQVLPEGTVFKLDRFFFENESKRFIDFCQDAGYPVFADAKIIEIPTKSLEIAKTYLKHKPWMLNIMAGACSTGIYEGDGELDALKRFADACHEVETKPCAVTVLTSKTEKLCSKEYRGRLPVEQVLTYVEMLIEAGFTDVVCSPLEAEAIRHEFESSINVNTPGVRLPDNKSDDQARVMTPRKAFEAGVNRIVVGRPITGDGTVDNFGKNYAKIIENIQMDK